MEAQIEMQVLMETEKDQKFLKGNLEKLRKEHPDKFVAIKNGKVIAEGTDMNTVKSKLKKAGVDPAITTVEFIHKKGAVKIL